MHQDSRTYFVFVYFTGPCLAAGTRFFGTSVIDASTDAKPRFQGSQVTERAAEIRIARHLSGGVSQGSKVGDCASTVG